MSMTLRCTSRDAYLECCSLEGFDGMREASMPAIWATRAAFRSLGVGLLHVSGQLCRRLQ